MVGLCGDSFTGVSIVKSNRFWVDLFRFVGDLRKEVEFQVHFNGLEIPSSGFQASSRLCVTAGQAWQGSPLSH